MRLQVATILVLLAMAAVQVGVALRGALRDPPVPPLYKRPVTMPTVTVESSPQGPSAPPPSPGGEGSQSPAVMGTPEVVRPDPANILRLTIAGRLSPARMEADANSRLQLMIENRGDLQRSVVVRAADGTVIEKSPPIAPGKVETIFVTLPRGQYQVRLDGAADVADLRVE